MTINTRGITFLQSSGVTVSATSVDIAFGIRRLPFLSLVVLDITEAIPTGTTATLPVQVSLNGGTIPLTAFNGAAVTAGDLVGTGKVLAIYDRFKGTLQVVPGIV